MSLLGHANTNAIQIQMQIHLHVFPNTSTKGRKGKFCKNTTTNLTFSLSKRLRCISFFLCTFSRDMFSIPPGFPCIDCGIVYIYSLLVWVKYLFLCICVFVYFITCRLTVRWLRHCVQLACLLSINSLNTLLKWAVWPPISLLIFFIIDFLQFLLINVDILIIDDCDHLFSVFIIGTTYGWVNSDHLGILT